MDFLTMCVCSNRIPIHKICVYSHQRLGVNTKNTFPVELRFKTALYGLFNYVCMLK